MFMVVTFLTLLSRFLYPAHGLRSCVPNTQVVVNDRICQCNNLGQLSESSCRLMGRRHTCKPGQIIKLGCKQCICQENGQLSCLEGACPNSPDYSKSSSISVCTPFKYYYMDCNICICPASGRMTESQCTRDPSCSLVKQPTASDLTPQTMCIPKVMYIFQCLRCLCSDDGHFMPHKCTGTCKGQGQIFDYRECTPKALFRVECNICKCPDNGLYNKKSCTEILYCNDTTSPTSLQALKDKSITCKPHRFITPRCLYCDCSSKGTVDENSCLELTCMPGVKYGVMQENCTPGESVPFCTECLCLRQGKTGNQYCSNLCSYESKIQILETLMQNSANDNTLIDREAVKRPNPNEVCESGTIYLDDGKFCLCPSNGFTNFNLCTSKEQSINKPENTVKIVPDFNITCEPHTFVEFDCNTCYCNKSGKIEPKWCTYDDCEGKRIIQTNNANIQLPEIPQNQLCTPGSITKVECNYCICPERGLLKDLLCTKNDCATYVYPPPTDKFTCEPLTYYEVDCNVCFCPKDGLKNVAKCTKNHCERGYLRSNICTAGQLFSDECNVCVCPPNGNKMDKVCTNYTCSDLAPWKKIFALTESLLGNQAAEDATRNLELCFPGEEYAVGCQLCVCPDMGLRVYASCSFMLCESESSESKTGPEEMQYKDYPVNGSTKLIPVSYRWQKARRDQHVTEDCNAYNLADNADTKQLCLPGSTYVSRCKQCICPSSSNFPSFCRPMPDNEHCELQNVPNINYLPVAKSNFTDVGPVKHLHTKYMCNKPGKVMDSCYICECQDLDKLLILEHCYKRESIECDKAEPTFLVDYIKVDKN